MSAWTPDDTFVDGQPMACPLVTCSRSHISPFSSISPGTGHVSVCGDMLRMRRRASCCSQHMCMHMLCWRALSREPGHDVTEPAPRYRGPVPVRVIRTLQSFHMIPDQLLVFRYCKAPTSSARCANRCTRSVLMWDRFLPSGSSYFRSLVGKL